MIKGETVLAVIPARGGSKRAPRKNLRPFRGVPLLLHSQAHALQSKYIDLVVCSTEDVEITALAQNHMLHVVPRPAELADDAATNEDVLRFVLKQVKDFDLVVLLQPTSPLRSAEDIDRCIELATTGWGCISYNDETHAKNGAIYVAYTEWLAKHDFGHAGLRRYEMPAERSLDIDYPEQFDA